MDFTSLFATLPKEIKEEVIYSFLEPSSRLCLRIALRGYYPKKEDFTHSLRQNIVKNGLTLTLYFWKWISWDNLLTTAAITDSLDVFQFLYETECKRDITIPYLAGLYASHFIIEFILSKGWEGDYLKEMFRGAAINGHLSIVTFLWPSFKKYNKVDGAFMAEIIQGGSIPVVSFLREQGVPLTLLDTIHTVKLTSSNNLAMLQYLRSYQCSWNKDVVTYASKYGRMDVFDMR